MLLSHISCNLGRWTPTYSCANFVTFWKVSAVVGNIHVDSTFFF
jgi:hypothetical protein